jgi:hypothetical protein
VGLFTNSGVGQANSAYNQASSTAGMLGGEAQGIGSQLTPFLTQEMLHPQGIGQTGLAAETASALGGAGGAASGLTGIANQRAAVSRNAGGFSAALDDASRNRSKAAADASEGVTGQNEALKQQQEQEGAVGLGGMYKTDTSGMLGAMGQEAPDIKAGIEAGQAGPAWMNTLNKGVGAGLGIAKLASGFGIHGFGGFAPGGSY